MLKNFLYATFTFSFLLAANPSAAITNGGPDEGDHPYVGLAVFDDAAGNPMWRCSGTLLSPTLFLTAGHCTEPSTGVVRATIWFEEDIEAGIPGNGYPFGGSTSVEGTPHTHPNYDDTHFYSYDLGVVILDEPVVMGEYGVLPEEGLLNSFLRRRGQQDTSITAAGYGLQKINPVFFEGQRVRLKATLRLIDLIGTAGVPAGTSVMLSNNAKTGGTCFGDSGGPLFQGNTNVVAAVTSFGMNGNCAGLGGGYRVDTEDDLDWLYDTFSSHLP